MPFLRVFALLLLLSPSAWSLVSTADADTDPATMQRLLERGVRELQRAERAATQQEPSVAKRYAREAESTFRAALELDPREHRAALLGAQAAVFARDLKGARSWAAKYRALTPYGERDPDLHYLRALIDLRVADRPDLAINHLRRMQAINARVRPAQRDLLLWDALDRHGWLLVRTGKPDVAQRQFLTAERVARRLGHTNKQKSSRANYAIALQHENRQTEAQEIFESLLAAEPDSMVWNLYLALCLGKQHKFEEAIPHYRKAVERHKPGAGPKRLEAELRKARLRLGNCYRFAAQGARDPALAKRLFADARTSIQAYIDLEPKSAVGYSWMGTLYFDDLEQPYNALPMFERAFALDPMCVQPLRRMIQIRRNYPPPAGVAEETWRAPVAALEKDLSEGAVRRKAALDERKHTTGGDGCE